MLNAPVDWVDIIYAAPIPVGVNFGATRHRQMIEQVRQRVFLTVESYYLCPAERRFPLALAACDLDDRTGIIRKPVKGPLSRSASVAPISVRLPPYPRAGVRQHISPPCFANGLMRG